MVSKRTMEAFFVRAAECEIRCAEIYAELSALCARVPSVATVWDSFAKDEMHHADMIREIQRSLTRQQLSASPTDDQWKNLLAGEDFLARPQVQSIQDLNDAYELAHEIENYELMSVFLLFVHEAVPDAQQEAYLKAQLDEHIYRLEEIGARWGSVAVRRAIRFRNV